MQQPKASNVQKLNANHNAKTKDDAATNRTGERQVVGAGGRRREGVLSVSYQSVKIDPFWEFRPILDLFLRIDGKRIV